MADFMDVNTIDVKLLSNDRDHFNAFVYTSHIDAADEIYRRSKNIKLKNKIESFLHYDIPKPLQESCKAVLFRQLFSPNYELRRFIHLIDVLNLEPMFLEYYEDKFTSINPLKHCLGKMRFQSDLDSSRLIIRNVNIIDFNSSQGKKINSVETVWGQSLIEFHHQLLEEIFPNSSQFLYDGSPWFHRQGDKARTYYVKYLALFIQNGILFENFTLDSEELEFIKDIFLPAFVYVWKAIGVKPIIVPLLSSHNQDEKYWSSYPLDMLDCVKSMRIV